MNAVAYDFQDSVVVVTGGLRGLGRSHVDAFLRAGANVVSIDVDQSCYPGVAYALSDVSAHSSALEEYATLGTFRSLVADVTCEDQVSAAFEDVRVRHGRVDILVNNAGVNSITPLDSMDELAWRAVVDTSLRGSFLCTRYAADLMPTGRDAAVVMIASMGAARGRVRPGQSHYMAAKVGLIGLAQALAVELGPRGVRVNAVCPSAVQTPMSSGLSSPGSQTTSKPTGNYALPHSDLPASDVTQAVLWLSSSAARSITGTCLIVDAGASIV